MSGKSTNTVVTRSRESQVAAGPKFVRRDRTLLCSDGADLQIPQDFAAAWTAWRDHRLSGSRPLAVSKLEDYDSMYRCYIGPYFGDMRLEQISAGSVGAFQLEMRSYGVSAVRYSKVVVPLCACLRWHFRIGAFPHDTTFWFDRPAPPANERKVLSFEEVERLLKALPAFHRPLIECAAYTGLRLGELRALSWQDVDLDRGIIQVRRAMDRDVLRMYTKTKSSRSVGIPDHLRSTLRDWRLASPESELGVVFPQRSGRVLDSSDFRKRVFKPALVRAGLDPSFRIHDLRHTAASWYVRAGASMADLMRIFGWSQMQTAMRYIHMLDTPTTLAALLTEARDGTLHDVEDAPPALRN